MAVKRFCAHASARKWLDRRSFDRRSAAWSREQRPHEIHELGCICVFEIIRHTSVSPPYYVFFRAARITWRFSATANINRAPPKMTATVTHDFVVECNDNKQAPSKMTKTVPTNERTKVGPELLAPSLNTEFLQVVRDPRAAIHGIADTWRDSRNKNDQATASDCTEMAAR